MGIDINKLTFLARIDPVVLKSILIQFDKRLDDLESQNKQLLAKMKELQSEVKK